MVRVSDNKVFIKILYWGSAASGKTTAVDTLYHITEKEKMDFIPTGNLVKIAMASGSTLYFDRGVFQSAKKSSIFFHVYTVAGQSRFSPLRKKIFMGTDGVIFVFDGQRDRWEDNVESLRELKAVAGDDLIKKLPLVIMLNKVDLENVITVQEVDELLQQEGLWYPPGHDLALWNPIVYPSIAVMPTAQNVYRAFTECARRTGLYQTFGQGSAPKRMKPTISKNVRDL
ncbi:MAG TPA: ADP-ribosylation factor-like protein [Candidatus Lokiarchaeia archaeon]|nr:ADP-ribosylation factor-like protein [Candidatus Lokiarchaeia archaeon]